MLPARWRDHLDSSQRVCVCGDGDGGRQELSLPLPMEGPGSACWPLIEETGLSRPGPAGRDKLSAERASQG